MNATEENNLAHRAMNPTETSKWHARRREIPRPILDLALVNPIIDRVVREFAGGQIITKTEALCRMVVVLATGPAVVQKTDNQSPEGRILIVQQVVTDHFRIHLSTMTNKSYAHHVAHPRQLAMYLCRELLGISFEYIGYVFGDRDHGTVIFACKAVQARMDTDAAFTATVGAIRTLLEQRLAA